jgi:hypothetical protein
VRLIQRVDGDETKSLPAGEETQIVNVMRMAKSSTRKFTIIPRNYGMLSNVLVLVTFRDVSGVTPIGRSSVTYFM